MKIIYNTDQIYLHGGIEKVMATKANYLANLEDYRVCILTTEQNQKPPCYPLDSKIELIDLGVNYNRSKSYFSFENLLKAKRHFFRQKKAFKTLNADVIISPNFNFDHYWLPFIKNKAVLIKEKHGSGFLEAKERRTPSLFRKLKFKFNDWIAAFYDRVVVLNKDEEAYVKSGNAVVIPNPVEETNLRADISKKRVIAAGRISPVKAFDQLIEIWSVIHKDFSEWQLHFYGQDYLGTQKRLEQLIDTYHLNNVIFFKGSVADLRRTMTDYSIYAMTSETECFPMVLLEALSVGLPVISYDCPNGPRNILKNHEDSFLTPDRNIPIFAENLTILMDNENLRKTMGAQGIFNVKRFDLKKVMKLWTDLFLLLTSIKK